MKQRWAGYVARIGGEYVTVDGYLSEDPGDAVYWDTREQAQEHSDLNEYHSAVIVMVEYEISYQEFL